jgi:hypothetical protein
MKLHKEMNSYTTHHVPFESIADNYSTRFTSYAAELEDKSFIYTNPTTE